MLLKNLSFTAVAVLTLALGIGGSAALLAVISGVLLRQLPFQNAERIVVVWRTKIERAPTSGLLSPAEFEGYSRSDSLSSLAAVEPVTELPISDQAPSPIIGARVTPSIFKTLGITPQLGREFSSDDSIQGGSQVAIISDGLRRSRYGASRDVLGKKIDLQVSAMNLDVVAASGTFTIIGVLPRGLPLVAFEALNTHVWIPLPPVSARENHTTYDFYLLGRLARGASVAQASAELIRTASA